MKNILKIVFVIIGTLIGAGFISGQEINTFFYSFGKQGIYGLILCSILISIIIYKTLKLVYYYKIQDYKQFLIIINKKSKKKYLNISYITNIIINIFIFITFCIMISGFGAYFNQEMKISSLIGSSLLAIICFFILIGNIQRIVKVNELLVPIIISFILILGLYNIKTINFYELNVNLVVTNSINWIISSLLYVSYNIILLIPVLITLKKYIKNKKSINYVSIISGIITFTLSLLLFLILSKLNLNTEKIEMPLAYIISNSMPNFKKIYGIIILASIFTTALSLGIGFLQNTTKNKKRYTQIAMIMCISSIFLSQIGFSNLINLLYPIFGILGLIQLINIVFIKINDK